MPRIVVVAALITLAPLAAFAHAHLRTAQPAPDATLGAAPPEIAIEFTEGVEPRFSSIELTGPSGSSVATGPAQIAPEDSKRLSVSLPKLPPGAYTVRWHATAIDTHKTEGTFHFTVSAIGD